MVQDKHKVEKHQAHGLGMLTSEAGLAAMHGVLLAGQFKQPVAVVGAASIHYWQALLAGVRNLPRMFTALNIRRRALQIQQEPSQPTSLQLQHGHANHEPATAAQSATAVEEAVTSAVAAVLGVHNVAADQPLAAQGLDSLAGLELRRNIQVPCHNLDWCGKRLVLQRQGVAACA